MAERRSTQDRKLDRLGTLADINARNTASQSGSMNSLLQQLTQMYGLSQAAQADPLKLEAQRLENEAVTQRNAWAQPMAEMQYNLGNAQAQVAQQRATGVPSPADFLDAIARGINPNDIPDYLLPPEVRAERQQEVAAKEAKRQAEQQIIDDNEFFSFLESGDRPGSFLSRPSVAFPINPPLPDAVTREANLAANAADPLNPVNFLTWLGSLVRKNPVPVSVTGSR